MTRRTRWLAAVVVSGAMLSAGCGGVSVDEQLVNRVFTGNESAQVVLANLPEEAAQPLIDAMTKQFELDDGVFFTGSDSLRVRVLADGAGESVIAATADEQLCVMEYRAGVTSSCADLTEVDANGLLLSVLPPGEDQTRLYGVAPRAATALGVDGPDLAIDDGAFAHRVSPTDTSRLQYFDGTEALSPLSFD